MENLQNIQWFPGHMQKTKRMIEKELNLIDLVIEVLDARLPFSSKNFDIDSIINSKKKLIILNKSDLAKQNYTNEWISYYKTNGILAISCDSKSGNNINKIIPSIKEILKETLENKYNKGIKNYKLKVMVMGIPNVGKSSLINKISKRKSTKVEDRPGVTRGKQWISIDSTIELLDIPGILWPKFEDQNIAVKLAFVGSVKDNILHIESLAIRLIDFLKQNYKDELIRVYKIDKETLSLSSFDILNNIAKKRGMILPKGEYNTERAAITLLDEFRMGKLGKVTLDYVSEFINYE